MMGFDKQIIFKIKLIMFTKSQSCDRCVRQNSGYLAATQPQGKTIKKPQSYLAKKFEQLYDEDRKLRDKKKSKIEQTLKIKEEKEVQGCTFKPEINTNPQYHIGNDPFLKREMDWKKHIDKKIAEKREQMSKKEKDSLTFQPKIIDSPLLSSQIKQTKSMKTQSNYSTKSSFIEKKSYKVLHSERKKFKQITKAIIVEPFKHRRQHSTSDSNQKLETSLHSYENVNKQPQQIEAKDQKIKQKMLTQGHEVQHEKEMPEESKETHNELKQLAFQMENDPIQPQIHQFQPQEEGQGQEF